MRTRGYQPISVPAKSHLDFDQMTVGELSNILRQWQALLQSAWRESYELAYSSRAPTMHLMTVSASTENSFELFSDFAIPAVYVANVILGPVKDWLPAAMNAYRYLASAWESRSRQPLAESSGHVLIRGGDSPEMMVPVSALRDTEVGPRVETLWSIANSGLIKVTVELPEE